LICKGEYTMQEEKFQQAINYFKAGNKKQAVELLLEIVDADPNNAEAWFGLALCTDTKEIKKKYLNEVLNINPNHPKALQLMNEITIEKQTNSPVIRKRSSTPIHTYISSVLIGILFMGVIWLFYRVDKLEKSLVLTQNNLMSTKTGLTNTQSDLTNTKSDLINIKSDLTNLDLDISTLFNELNSTRSSLASTISTLNYVESLAVNANNYAHSHNSYSDRRLKKDISEINDPLEGILSLNGVNFSWNTLKYPDFGLSDDPQIGFIAQDLEKVYPQLVTIDENGYKMVDYEKLVPVLVEAIKQQQLMIIELQEKVMEIQQHIHTID